MSQEGPADSSLAASVVTPFPSDVVFRVTKKNHQET